MNVSSMSSSTRSHKFDLFCA